MPKTTQISRRQFIHQSAAVSGAVLVASDLLNAEAARPVPTATDWVPLGRLNKNKIMIPRLGMGTGSINGKIQRDLGQAGFNKLVAYAYERGVRYIDTAKNYTIHDMVAAAIKANKLPREKIFVQSKIPSWKEYENPLAEIDSYRKELGLDYIDSLLIHVTTTSDWPDKLKSVMEAINEAQHKGWIRTKGMSCHGLAALRQAAISDWMEVQLARINPQAHHVDGDNPTNPHDPKGKLAEAMKEIKSMYDKGRGIIGMKLCGNGDFKDPADREKAIHYAMTCGFVNAVVIGFKSNAEIDEAISRINQSLTAKN